MKVWVCVFHSEVEYECGYSEVDEVFDSKEKAEKWLKEHPALDDVVLHEWPEIIEMEVK